MSREDVVLLISGIDTIGSGRLPGLFAAAGYTVHLLGSDRLAVNRSKFVSESIWSEAGPHATALATYDYLTAHRDKYAYIVLDDEPTFWSVLDAKGTDHHSREWLRGWFPAPLTAESLDRLNSKTSFLRDARAAGLATPEFVICHTPAELRHAAAQIGFPVFVKAAHGWAGSGLIYTRSLADLDAQIPRISFEDGPAVVQQEVNGAPGSLSVLYHEGIPVCWFSYLMARTWPNRFSSACTVRFLPHRDADMIVSSIGSLTGFNGLAGIDYVFDRKNDRLVFLEFNPRPTPVYHLGPRVGVDFPRSLSQIRLGENVSRQAPNATQAEVELYPQALYQAVEHFEFGTLFKAFRDAPWNEPALNFAYFRRFLTHYVPASVKEKLKH